MTGQDAKMTDEKRREALLKLGAACADLPALLAYTANAFAPSPDPWGSDLPPAWDSVWEKVQKICLTPPRLEIYAAVAGPIPIIYPAGVADFHALIRGISGKDKDVPHIENMGAQFFHGRTLRFIILSDKPYSGIPATSLSLAEDEWRQKSLLIRKMHECAHYYTRRFLGSAKNNLHDELIADFFGIHAAFGRYEAALFLRFFAARSAIYTGELSDGAARVISALAEQAAHGAEAWSRTDEFRQMDEAARIEYLAGREVLDYVT